MSKINLTKREEFNREKKELEESKVALVEKE